MAMSYGAAFIYTSAIVGFGGAPSLFGFSMLWLVVLCILVGIFLAFAVFGKRTRRMGLKLQAHAFPELLERRYNSPFIQKFMGLVIFILCPSMLRQSSLDHHVLSKAYWESPTYTLC